MSYHCTDCSFVTESKIARCPQCKKLGTITLSAGVTGASIRDVRVVMSTDATQPAPPRLLSGIAEYDQTLGGGIERGYVQVIAGEGGSGKSTLALQVAGAIAQSGHCVLYASGEEQIHRLQERAGRIGAKHRNLVFTKECDVVTLSSLMDKERYDLVVLDSIQAAHSEGKRNEIDVAAWMIAASQRNGTASIIISQVTKDGAMAGKNAVFHMVDVVLWLDGSGEETRILRAKKNRGGDVGEVGVFTMAARGLQPVQDLARLFLNERKTPVAGCIATMQPQGRRVIPVEIHAIVQDDGMTKTITSGIGRDRVDIIRAALEYHLPHIFDLKRANVYVSVPGGIEITDSSCDLAVALLLAAVVRRVPTSHVCAIGEVALSGEIMQKQRTARWEKEAGGMGFTMWRPNNAASLAEEIENKLDELSISKRQSINNHLIDSDNHPKT